MRKRNKSKPKSSRDGGGSGGGFMGAIADSIQAAASHTASDSKSKDETGLTSKNYKLAKELSEVRVRHQEETKNVTRLTMENMNLASRCREAITQAATMKRDLSAQKKKTAEAVAQTHQLLDQLKKLKQNERKLVAAAEAGTVTDGAATTTTSSEVGAPPPPVLTTLPTVDATTAVEDASTTNRSPASVVMLNDAELTKPLQLPQRASEATNPTDPVVDPIKTTTTAVVAPRSTTPDEAKDNGNTDTVVSETPLVKPPSTTVVSKPPPVETFHNTPAIDVITSDFKEEPSPLTIVMSPDSISMPSAIARAVEFDDSEHKEDDVHPMETPISQDKKQFDGATPATGLVSSDDYENSLEESPVKSAVQFKSHIEPSTLIVSASSGKQQTSNVISLNDHADKECKDEWVEDYDEAAEVADRVMGLGEQPGVKKQFFPHSASPLPRYRKTSLNDSYDEEFPTDMVHQPADRKTRSTLGGCSETPDETDGANPLPAADEKSPLNLLSSIDAFERSFNTNIIDSFSPREEIANLPSPPSDEKAIDGDTYNPFDTTSPEKTTLILPKGVAAPKKDSPPMLQQPVLSAVVTASSSSTEDDDDGKNNNSNVAIVMSGSSSTPSAGKATLTRSIRDRAAGARDRRTAVSDPPGQVSSSSSSQPKCVVDPNTPGWLTKVKETVDSTKKMQNNLTIAKTDSSGSSQASASVKQESDRSSKENSPAQDQPVNTPATRSYSSKERTFLSSISKRSVETSPDKDTASPQSKSNVIISSRLANGTRRLITTTKQIPKSPTRSNRFSTLMNPATTKDASPDSVVSTDSQKNDYQSVRARYEKKPVSPGNSAEKAATSRNTEKASQILRGGVVQRLNSAKATVDGLGKIVTESPRSDPGQSEGRIGRSVNVNVLERAARFSRSPSTDYTSQGRSPVVTSPVMMDDGDIPMDSNLSPRRTELSPSTTRSASLSRPSTDETKPAFRSWRRSSLGTGTTPKATMLDKSDDESEIAALNAAGQVSPRYNRATGRQRRNVNLSHHHHRGAVSARLSRRTDSGEEASST